MQHPDNFARLMEECRARRGNPDYDAKLDRLSYDARKLVAMFEGAWGIDAILEHFAWHFHGEGRRLTEDARGAAMAYFMQLLPDIRSVLDSD